MKKHILNIVFAFGCTLIASCTNPYKDLDYAIEHSSEWDAAYGSMQESLYTQYANTTEDSAKFEAAYKIQKEYFYHSADSCYKYARIMERLSSVSQEAKALSNASLSRILIRLDSLDKAATILSTVDPNNIRAESQYVYYTTKYTLLKNQNPGDTASINEVLRQWRQKDSVHADCLYLSSNNIEGLEELIRNPISRNEYAKANFGLGMIYLANGDEKNAIKYLAESAKTDMEISVKGYGALYELARILMRRGDVKRAIRYISRTRQDAQAYNYASRLKVITENELETMNILLAQERKQKNILFVIIPVIIALLFTAIFIMLRLSHSQRKLKEVSSIKDNFLTTYMERCVDYLNKVDEYRSDLRHTAKKDGADAVLAILRKPSFADSEFHKLLHEFDTAFLGIFPDFVDKINGITKEEYHYKLTEDGSLTTNLRILALIRLGITERKKIAKILNMSVGTVYAYHTHLQQHSTCTPAEFDKVVKKL